MANFMDAMQRGYQFGAQMRENREKKSRLAELEGIAGQVAQGDPTATMRALTLNPEGATKLIDEGSRQRRTLYNIATSIKKAEGNPQMQSSIYRQAAPYLRSQFGADVPEEFDPSTAMPVVDQVLATMASEATSGNIPSQFAALDMQAKAAGYQPGTQGYQDFFRRANGELARQSGAAIQYKEVEIDGRKVLVAVDPREIGAQVIGGGPAYGSYAGQLAQVSAPAAAPGRADMEADIELANSMIAARIPEAQVDAFLAQRGQRASAPRSAQGAATPAGGAAIAGNPFASRTPEESAAEVERARLNAQLNALPAELGMRTQAAINQAVGIDEGKAQAERARDAEQKLTRVTNDASNMLAMIERVKNSPGREIVTGLSGTLDPRAYLPGGAAADFRANLQQLQGSAFLQAFESLKGGGAITEIEGKKAEQAIASLQTDQSDEGFMRSIATLEQVIRGGVAKAQRDASRLGRGQQSPQPQQQGAVRIQNAEDYNRLPPGALYITPTGETRRKR